MTCQSDKNYAIMTDPPTKRNTVVPHTCQWLLSPTDPEKIVCGDTASSEVTVKTKITIARVWLCAYHKREHDISFAKARTSIKKPK